MAKSYYLPTADKDKALWLKNFATKFNGYAPSLGFSPAEATAVQNDSFMFTYMLDVLETFKSELRERTTYKDVLRDGPLGSTLGTMPAVSLIPPAPTSVPAGVFPRISAIVKRMKAHPAYTEAIGKDCGIIGSEKDTTTIEMKPSLSIVLEAGVPVVKYTKGKADGIRLLSIRGVQTNFALLDVVTKTSYKDVRPNENIGQPEMRKYCAWYIKNDAIIGQCSDVVTFVV